MTPGPGLLSRSRLVGWVGAQDWAHETRRSMYASLRGFFRWAAEVEGIEDISDCLPSVKPGEPLPRPVTESDYFRALDDAVRAGDERAHVILRLAGEAGLRRAEIAQINRCDLIADLAGWTLVVHGKGNKDRFVPLTDSLAAEVRRVMGKRRWLLPNEATGDHLTPRHVGKIGSRYLPRGVGLHAGRHRFAAQVDAKTNDLRSLQALLGHASLATTQRYVPIRLDALRNAVAAVAG